MTPYNWVAMFLMVAANLLTIGISVGVMRTRLVVIEEQLDQLYKHVFNGMTAKINQMSVDLGVLSAVFSERTKRM